MSKLNRFTDEQLARANNVSIVDYAMQRGFKLKKFGKDYKLPGYGGLLISPQKNCWNWYSQNTGGGIIQFVMEFENLTWVEAVKKLLGEDVDSYRTYNRDIIIRNKKKVEFKLPEKNKNFNHIYAYLIKTRCIDKSIVNKMINEDYLYENKYGSCVFVGKDENGVSRCANVRGTSGSFKQDIEGGNKDYAFNYPGINDVLNVFEAPIDLLSYMTLQKINGSCLDDHYQALACVADRALRQYLKTHTEIRTIRLCTDNDKYGNEAALYLQSELCGDYKVIRHKPKLKDFNEDLQALMNGHTNERVSNG